MVPWQALRSLEWPLCHQWWVQGVRGGSCPSEPKLKGMCVNVFICEICMCDSEFVSCVCKWDGVFVGVYLCLCLYVCIKDCEWQCVSTYVWLCMHVCLPACLVLEAQSARDHLFPFSSIPIERRPVLGQLLRRGGGQLRPPQFCSIKAEAGPGQHAVAATQAATQRALFPAASPWSLGPPPDHKPAGEDIQK